MKKLKGENTILIIFYSLITLGFYPALYIRKKTKILNEFWTDLPISGFFTEMVVIAAIASAFAIFVDIISVYYEITEPFSRWMGLLKEARVVSPALNMAWCFLARDRIHDYLKCNDDKKRRLSGALIFIFGVFYLNYKINKEIDESTPDLVAANH